VGGSKILVVDDDADIRRMAALALERLGGFQVVLAEDAAQGIELAARERPDLILLDVSMPGTDGPAALAAIRADERTREVPVVFFTAASADAEVARLQSLGAMAVVPKPFEVSDLPRRIRAVLADVAWHGGPSDALTAARAAFARSLPAKAAELEALVARGAWEDARRGAHKLRGSGATYGCVAVSEHAAAIEEVLLAAGSQPGAEARARVEAGLAALRAEAERAAVAP
jgi:CheY-like chemotaxis protein